MLAHTYLHVHVCVCACVRITKVQENTNIEHNGNNNVRNDWKRGVDAAAAVAAAFAIAAVVAATAAAATATACLPARSASGMSVRASREAVAGSRSSRLASGPTHNKSLQIDWNYRKTI